MRSGNLRHLITIQQPVETQSDSGELVTTWSDFATVYGAISHLRGTEQYIAPAQQVTGSGDYKIKIRYIAGITIKMRVKFGDRIFQITAINNWDERNREIDLQTYEVL